MLCALDTCLVSPGLLAAMLVGYLVLVLASVWLSTAELRLPLVQYASSAPPPPDARGTGGGLVGEGCGELVWRWCGAGVALGWRWGVFCLITEIES